jgi:NAD(P)-dependent dehydrogenase (short-subunit alcohol dehydrogenase family)
LKEGRGRVAVVTGSGRGIGRSIAQALAASGNRVVVNVKRNKEEGLQTLDLVRRSGGGGIFVQADVSTNDGAKTLLTEAVSQLGSVDVLVNNAGLGIAAPLDRVDEALWDKQVNTNLKSVFLCSKYACETMSKKGWGRIVNISSVAGLTGMAELIPYSAAKAGVIGLTKALAAEMSPKGITVNAIAAGLIDTKMGRSLVDYIDKEAGRPTEGNPTGGWALKHTLTGRLPTAAEVARMVDFLASEDSGSITGQVFVIDSGWTLNEAKAYED